MSKFTIERLNRRKKRRVIKSGNYTEEMPNIDAKLEPIPEETK